MVCDVFVQICEDEQQLQHTVPLLGIRIGGPCFEVLDDGQRVGQQPFNVAAFQRKSLAAPPQGMVGSQERLVQKMIEAELFGCQCWGDRVCARCPLTAPGDGGHGFTHYLGLNRRVSA